MTEHRLPSPDTPGRRIALVAAAGPDGMPLVAQRWPAARLPLIDRPFIQHVLERLVRSGFQDFEVILCQRPETVERLLGDGTRWGCRIRYHLVRDPQRPYGPLRFFLPNDPPAPCLLAHADRLPAVDLAAAARPAHGRAASWKSMPTATRLGPAGPGCRPRGVCRTTFRNSIRPNWKPC